MNSQLRRVGFIFLLVLLQSVIAKAQTYCEPLVTNNIDRIYIDDFSIGSQLSNNSTSFSANGYNDFTSIAATLTSGDTYTFSFKTDSDEWSGFPPQSWFSIFIDFNDDGDFFDQNELVYRTTGGPDGQNFNYNYTIPLGVTPGSYRLRIRTNDYWMDQSPCYVYNNGAETEDYTLNILQPINPVATDDSLSVLLNSNPGADNRIDVSFNDNIGSSNGSDGEDYTLISASPTASGGVITEITDGVFQYIPGANYVGTDSFNYTMCDAANQCVTATVHVNINYGACIPTSVSNGLNYLDNVTIAGESGSQINNTSGDDGGYGSYIGLPTLKVFAGNTYSINLTAISNGSDSGWAAYIDYNRDGVFNVTTDEKIVDTNGTVALPYPAASFTVPSNIGLGKYILRVGTRQYFSANNPCGNTANSNEEFEDYVVEVIINPSSVRTASLSGNNVGITDGDTTTSPSNHTNFGVVDINGGSRISTFKITNAGGADLKLGVNPISFVGMAVPEFTIVSQPAGSTIIPSGSSEIFTIKFEPTSVANFSALVRVKSNSTPSGTNNYDFMISGDGEQIYPDTDGDGVSDNIDIDDDNDGIRDSDEQNVCLINPLSSSADVIFLNETFGAGLNRVRIDDLTPGVTTSYCYEDGTTAQGADECDNNPDLQDGKYTVHYSISDGNSTTDISATGPDLASWSDIYWTETLDHTPGDTNGRMAVFNASYTPGVFYETEIVGIIPNAIFTYSFWALNVDSPRSVFGGDRIKPNITVNFYSLDKSTLYQTYNTGDVERCDVAPFDDSCAQSLWQEYGTSLSLPVSDFIIQFVNNSPGGGGNDIALDDIKITQKLCDLDGDGVADVVDLDNDNDGIPNVYELGLPSGYTDVDTDRDGTMIGDTQWVDTNGNGMNDAYEAHTPRDTDNDGIPDYLDLDSDNDGIFDVLEYDGLGDLDVNGDGIGDGIDTDSGLADDENDGDGLLPLIDNNDDDNDKLDHGTIGYVPPIDTDNDGIPDYIDLDSNDAANDLSNGSDIDNSLYADQDGDGDGMVDGTNDTDRDGVYDGSNDYDTTIYGAPIDVNRDLFIDFDGRNDYIQTTNSVTSGLTHMTMMGWIMKEGGNNPFIMGELQSFMRLRNDNTFFARIRNNNGGDYTINSDTAIENDKWYHVAVTFDTTNKEIFLYLNGVEVGSNTSIATDPIKSELTEKFTVGNVPQFVGTAGTYFNGGIDEVKIFDKALTPVQLRRVMHQEVEANGVQLTGKVLPRDITGLLWSDLLVYYSFNQLKADQLNDESTTTTDGTMYNIKSILPQSAPLPYVTIQDGNLDNSSTLLRNDVWDADDIENFPHSIIKVSHDVTAQKDLGFTGMVVDNGGVINVNDGFHIQNDWYFILNGKMILEGDAQLLQSDMSELDKTSSGTIERKQQGVSDVYSYNYWSSPVGISNNTTNNNSFYLKDLEDAAGQVSFTGFGVGTPPVTSPVTLSGRWLYTFLNGSTYNDWSLIAPNTTAIKAGHGWSQKGTGTTAATQEYIFKGKPNNGIINIPAIPNAGANTTSLLGNPYPSAIDMRAFIDDNLGVIDGTVYLWDQFRGTNHQLAYYEGGYATITKLATVKAAQYDGLGYLNGGAGPAVRPSFFIPVAQGFFVTVENNGTIQFNNSQRVFKKEADYDGSLTNGSIFLGAPGTNPAAQDASSYQDMNIKLLRLELIADSGASREIAIGFDAALTDGYDKGYDAYASGTLNETDMYVPANGDNFIIRALSDITIDKVVDLAVKGVTTKMYKIVASDFTNIDVNQDVWLRDNELNTYHDLKSGDYNFTFSQDGLDENRFDIVFNNQTLSSGQFDLNETTVFLDNSSSTLFINGLESSLDGLSIYDLSGKLIASFRESELETPQSGINIPRVSTGIYLVTMNLNNTQQTVKLAVE
ncbi:MAG: GEVED domain-containing protein [Nonlabens sp.]|uniref:GEVED domain-containing protein n=1 Tax=Nonlabens sp. TaxID=1888209 RepID=UPI003EF96D01